MTWSLEIWINYYEGKLIICQNQISKLEKQISEYKITYLDCLEYQYLHYSLKEWRDNKQYFEEQLQWYKSL